MSKICFGCGAKLQSVDPLGLGYIPEEKQEDAKYCKRCFRMMHYGEIKSGDKPKNTKEIINTVNKHAKYVVFMVDFIDIFDDVMSIFASIKVPKVLVVSKSDIIPKNVSFETIKNYLRRIYRVRDEIIFTSYKSKLNKFIKNLYDKDEVYFLGLTNVGKSTILNMLIEEAGANATKLTTSYKSNTTQDFVRIKIGNKTYVDSPGFVIEAYEPKDEEKNSSEIKPKVYQNKVPCTYKIGKNLEIGINGKTSAIFYFSQKLDFKRVYKEKSNGVVFSVKGNSDVVIAGLGFVKFMDDAEIVIDDDLMKYINVRPSLVGGLYE